MIARLGIGLVVLDVVVVVLGNVLGAPSRWPDIEVPTIGSLFASLSGEPLIHIAGEPAAAAGGISVSTEISIPNSIVTMWLVMAALILVSFAATRRLELHPAGLQNAVELAVQGLSDFVVSTGGPRALKYLPLFGTLFVFIVLSNWLSVVPFVSQIPLLHSPTADYHVNFGLAVMAFVAYQAEGIRTHGVRYFSKFINLSGFRENVGMGLIMLFVGVIELAAEIFRMLTLTLRLWGNVLGGEIMLGVISAVLFLVAVPAALPFVGLELFIGLIQGLIFSLLVLMYFILAIEHHDEAHVEAESTKEGAHA